MLATHQSFKRLADWLAICRTSLLTTTPRPSCGDLSSAHAVLNAITSATTAGGSPGSSKTSNQQASDASAPTDQNGPGSPHCLPK